jgi:hypothetical protein
MNVDLTDDQTIEALDALSEDGTTYEFEADDGRVFVIKLHTEHDPDSSINDYESYGQLSTWTRDGFCGSTRPRGFGPLARIICRDRGSTLWWQPTPELWGTPKPWDGPTFEADWIIAKTLFEDGFYQVGVSLHETVTDSLGGEHVVEVCSAWLGGVDSAEGEWLRDIVSDLLADLFHDN